MNEFILSLVPAIWLAFMAIVLTASFYAVRILGYVLKRQRIEYHSRVDAQEAFVTEKWVRYAEEYVERSVALGLFARDQSSVLKAQTAVDGLSEELQIAPEYAHVLIHAALIGQNNGSAVKALCGWPTPAIET